MHTQSEIEDSIRQNLAIAFGKADAVDSSAYQTKHNALIDYATAVSEPFLRAETVRYQSMLLYVSLLFVSVSLLRIKNIKLFDATLSVDARLLMLYAAFIAAVGIIFLVKAYVDVQRTRFVRGKNVNVVSELRQMINIGLLKRRIQEHFWLEIFDAIGKAYKAYDEAASKAINTASTYEPTAMNLLDTDLATLRKAPELAAEIQAQEKHLAALTSALAADEARFRDRSEVIFATAASAPPAPARTFSYQVYQDVETAFDQILRKWFDARNALSTEHLTIKLEEMKATPEIQRLQAMNVVFKRILGVRRFYAVLEIAAPVVFAIAAIAIVWIA